MSVLQRSDLEASPLADLHALASTLNIDGFRRLRRDELIDAILARQEGREADREGDAPPADEGADEGQPPSGRRRGRWHLPGLRDHEASAEPAEINEEPTASEAPPEDQDAGAEHHDESEPDERDREVPAGRSARGRSRAAERTIDGPIELQPNGSGFIRTIDGEESDDDVYVSAAQVRRCELVPGDRVSGPVRPARRSERYASLIRVETINGEPADQVAAGTRFDDLAATFPNAQLAFGDRDETLAAIDRLAPIGQGSRVVIAGPARSGKTELLRRVARALAERDGLSIELVLVGVRPEEVPEWQQSARVVPQALSFATPAEAQAQAVEQAVERGRRIAARGGDAVVLVDTLDGLHPPAARRALAAARNLAEHGSLTIVATAAKPFGGETTVLALDPVRAGAGQLPALDPLASGTLRPEALVGEQAAAEIVAAHADALKAAGA